MVAVVVVSGMVWLVVVAVVVVVVVVVVLEPSQLTHTIPNISTSEILMRFI